MASSVRRYLAPLGVATVLTTLGGCRDGAESQPSSQTQPAGAAQANLSPAAVTLCLQTDGVLIGDVQPRDARLQAFHDLAQKTSFEARLGQRSVAVAVAATAGDAQLLAELLQVPDDPYRVVVNGNVVIMYQADAEDTYRSVVRCVRG